MATGQTCYSTNFDLSSPSGPGVNEQQFVMSISRLQGDKMVYVLPRPANQLPAGFPREDCVYYEHQPGGPIGRVASAIRKLSMLRRLARSGEIGRFVFRIGVFPLAELLVALTSRATICVKTFGPRTVEVFDEKPFVVRMLSPFNRLVTRALLRRAAVIDVVSPIHQAAVCEIYGLDKNKVRVIDNAVDSRRFRPLDKSGCREDLGLPAGEPIVGYVGNLASTRGAKELVQSVALLRQQGTSAHGLIVSGDLAGFDELKSMARDQGVADYVYFRGPVPLEEVPKYISAVDVALSMRDDDGCSELKVRQYISCGTPVIASAAVNGFIEEAGLGTMVDRSDSQQVARAIDKWLGIVSTKDSNGEFAASLHRYAAGNLDFDAANRKRLEAWSERCC